MNYKKFWNWFLDQTPRMEKDYCGECSEARIYRRDFEELRKEYQSSKESAKNE